jgi:hypothetical protein
LNEPVSKPGLPQTIGYLAGTEEAVDMANKQSNKAQKSMNESAKRVPSVKRLKPVLTLHCSKSLPA